eukprot:snap_masked-scaffold_17-processed-gene-1.22-mRNA-1 protein AED:1.00 eAED:1.00 QI:0/-1/0/0/-1/1/1/0/75
MIAWLVAFLTLGKLFLEGDLIKISTLIEPHRREDYCAETTFYYKKKYFENYKDCWRFEQPLLIEHFIHRASSEFI